MSADEVPESGGLAQVVPCAGGLHVAQRGAPDGPADLMVGRVAVVSPPTTRPIEARRADSVIWRRHWNEPERLVIEFVDIAVTEVAEATGIVTFDRELSAEMEQHLLLDHILPLVLARRGALVLHGAVIGRDAEAAVLVGATGAGKSTLTTFAWERGWTVGGDDGAVITPGDPCLVEPTYATIRLTQASVELLGIDPASGSAVIGKTRIDRPSEFRLEPVPVRVVAILEPVDSGNVARFRPLEDIDAHARLFGSTFHADLSRTRRLPSVVDGLASLVESSIVGYLDVPKGVEGLRGAEQVLAGLFDGQTHRLAAP